MKVKLLTDDLISKLAAGEVVERPASVVRELVDNAIDAAAKNIRIELLDGGHSLIEVEDDGSGMDPEDLLLALKPHATSKISCLEDLESIRSKGFRGEALPSIASVSRMTIRSKANQGLEIVTVAGEITSKPVNAQQGTLVRIENLFFNTPARKKFLKKPVSEIRKIKDWLYKYALAHHEVRFRLISDGKELVNLPACKTFYERAKNIFRGNYLPFNLELTNLKTFGLISHPDNSYKNSSQLVVLVNQRLISDRMIIQAAKAGFDSMLRFSEVPQGVICLELDSSLLDVNVHPQKTEVRFERSDVIFRIVKEAIREALASFAKPSQAFNVNQAVGSTAVNIGFDYQTYQPAHTNSQNIAEFVVPQKISKLRYIGQIFACYLLCESEGKFVIVDMHAAHERYNFNLIRNFMKKREKRSQVLLLPSSVLLGTTATMRLLELLPVLTQFGFEIDQQGEDSVTVRAIPEILLNFKIEEVIKELSLCDYPEDSEAVFNAFVDSLAARIACHASLRSGDLLNKEEVYALFDALESSEFAAACPHGRPIMVEFSEKTIETWFGRDR